MSANAMWIGAAIALAVLCGSAQAQSNRTFVSGHGSDANNCGLPTPCRTFQHAHDQTSPGGEITVLDPAGYGSVTITKAIGIVNDGAGEAGITVASGTNGVTVNAQPGDKVSLRGLVIRGAGTGNGIVFNSGDSLTVENCVIRNMSGTGTAGVGIWFQPAASAGLAVLNTLVADNAFQGVLVQPVGSGTVTATLSQVSMYDSGFRGLLINGGTGQSTAVIDAVVTDSISARNHTAGYTIGAGAPKAQLTLVRSVAAQNSGDGGISVVNPNATLRVGQSTITQNTASWLVVQNGVLRSYGDNKIDGNGDGDPAIPTVIPNK